MKISIFIFIIYLLNKAFGSPAMTHLIVTRVGPCAENRRMTIRVAEMSLHRVEYEFSLSGVINVTKDIQNGWNIKATMQKCHDIRNLDTCDFHKAFTVVKNGCVNSEEKDVYSVFLKYVKPTLDCPIRAGSYKIINFPFITESGELSAAEAKISTSVFGYTYRLEMFENDERILCVESYLRMIYLRIHKWSEGLGVISTTPAPAIEEGEEDAEKNASDNEDV